MQDSSEAGKRSEKFSCKIFIYVQCNIEENDYASMEHLQCAIANSI